MPDLSRLTMAPNSCNSIRGDLCRGERADDTGAVMVNLADADRS